MTEKELEAAADIYEATYYYETPKQSFISGYKVGKAETEKELENEILELRKSNAELEKENAELKIQIEKMKCCENCGWYYLQQHWRESEEINESRMFHCGTCGNKRNWKLRIYKE